MAATNKEVINTVLKDMPAETRALMEGKSGVELLAVFDDYPHAKNSFLENMTNKVAKTFIYSKIYENPWKILKKEAVPYGDSVEDLFVQMAQMKNFSENWDTGGTPEANLIRKIKPVVMAMYNTVNMDKKAKATISDKEMKKAFLTEGGLGRMIQQIVGSITTALEQNEYKAMVNTLFRTIDGIKYTGENFVGNTIGSGSSQVTLKKIKAIEVPNYDTKPQELVRLIRSHVGKMKYMKTDYNSADQMTFTRPENMVFITDPDVIANLDVNVLAFAFNQSSTDIKQRIIELDEFDVRGAKASAYTTADDGISQTIDTTSTSAIPDGKTVLGVLMSEDFLQIRDTDQGAGTFYNPEGKYTNHFANREYILASCLFENCVVFYK